MSTRAAIYLRQSLDRADDRLAVDRQREDALEIIQARGWELVQGYEDNSVSASDKRKHRPGYAAMEDDFKAGRFDALVCADLDRLTRQPRQLEDWIDAAEERGLALVTTNGEADLTTDSGRLFARVKLAVAKAEVERKSARQRRAARQRAEKGMAPKGTRLTGYTTGGEVIEAEALMVAKVFQRFAAGDSLTGIAAELNEKGVPTRRGGQWGPSSVSTILKNPRYAGRVRYRGEVLPDPGAWPAIVDAGVFDLCAARLADPRRKTSKVGTHRRHLGSGLYLCGLCATRTLVRSHTGGSVHRYRCPNGCLTRSAQSIDGLVIDVVRRRLAMPDVLAATGKVDDELVRSLDQQATTLRARQGSIESDYDAGLIDGRRYAAATEKVALELTEVTTRRARLAGQGGLLGVVDTPDPVATFDAAPLQVRRAVVDALVEVKLHPAKRGAHFDPSTVGIEWR